MSTKLRYRYASAVRRTVAADRRQFGRRVGGALSAYTTCDVCASHTRVYASLYSQRGHTSTRASCMSDGRERSSADVAGDTRVCNVHGLRLTRSRQPTTCRPHFGVCCAVRQGINSNGSGYQRPMNELSLIRRPTSFFIILL